MRKERVGAGLVFGAVVTVLGLAALERHHVIAPDLHDSILLAAGRNRKQEGERVAEVQNAQDQDHDERSSFHLLRDNTIFFATPNPSRDPFRGTAQETVEQAVQIAAGYRT